MLVVLPQIPRTDKKTFSYLLDDLFFYLKQKKKQKKKKEVLIVSTLRYCVELVKWFFLHVSFEQHMA